jgi:hypothetical protein
VGLILDSPAVCIMPMYWPFRWVGRVRVYELGYREPLSIPAGIARNWPEQVSKHIQKMAMPPSMGSAGGIRVELEILSTQNVQGGPQRVVLVAKHEQRSSLCIQMELELSYRLK